MQDTELALETWTPDLVGATTPAAPSEERLPLILCWAVWFGFSGLAWLILISPLLR
jgi:hypothetical protein